MERRKIKGRFFRAFFDQGNGYHFGVATSISKTNLDTFFINGHVNNWETATFILRKEHGLLADFLGSNVCQHLCSEKVKNIIDSLRTKLDMSIQWLPATIHDEKTGVTHNYFYLHFPEVCDSLDEEASDIDRWGSPITPVFDYYKIKDRSICNCRGSSLVLMSNNLKNALFQANCTGFQFNEALVYEKLRHEPNKAP